MELVSWRHETRATVWREWPYSVDSIGFGRDRAGRLSKGSEARIVAVEAPRSGASGCADPGRLEVSHPDPTSRVSRRIEESLMP